VNEINILLADEDATMELGAKLGAALTGGGIVYLQGDLGAGKTTLCRGLLRSLEYLGAVKSPTYTLVEPYEINNRRLFHFDLYRLGDGEELEYMGIRDYFAEDNLCLIEWPERGEGFLPAADLIVKVLPLAMGKTMGREAKINALSSLGSNVVTQLSLSLSFKQLAPNKVE